jgi:hypothetical protein
VAVCGWRVGIDADVEGSGAIFVGDWGSVLGISVGSISGEADALASAAGGFLRNLRELGEVFLVGFGEDGGAVSEVAGAVGGAFAFGEVGAGGVGGCGWV